MVEIRDPERYKQVLAVSDVHGMYEPLVRLLQNNSVIDSENHWIARQTLLIVVGDSVDKGDHSVEVLDFWIGLEAEAMRAGGRLIHLLGNHEAEALALRTDSGKSKELFKELKRRGIKKKEFISMESRWGRYLRSMPLAAKVGRWLFCHAGRYPAMSWREFVDTSNRLIGAGDYNNAFFQGEQSIVEAKDWWSTTKEREALKKRIEENGIWGIVQGHQPKAFDLKEKIAAIEGGRFVKIDNGMSPHGGEHPGSLLRFVNPEQMAAARMPDLEVLTHKGKTQEVPVYP